MLAIEQDKRGEQYSQSPIRGSQMKPRTFDSVYDLRDRKMVASKLKD